MTTSTECKAIFQKLHAIMSGIDFIAKDKKNDFHGYRYASEYAIKRDLHAQLVKHGVVFSLGADSYTETEHKNAKGETVFHANAMFVYRFTDIESGEWISDKFPGMGEDKNDKALWQAITGSIKYILTSNFLIPTGDDPEADRALNSSKSEPKQEQEPKYESVETKPEHVTGIACEKCGSAMKEKKGPRGPFLGCSNYPTCKNTKSL